MMCVLCFPKEVKALIVWGGFGLCKPHVDRVVLARYESKWMATAIDIVEVLTVAPDFDFETYEDQARAADLVPASLADLLTKPRSS